MRVRDLPAHGLGVDIENAFEPTYELSPARKKVIKELAKLAAKSPSVYLATDLDREGEAISWHLIEILKEKGALNGKPVHRVVFYEITKNAVKEAIEHPRDISDDLVAAAQAAAAAVQEALVKTGGNKARAARELGVGRATLYRFISEHPDVILVAVVAMPGPQMGEKACAYIQSPPRSDLTF